MATPTLLPEPDRLALEYLSATDHGIAVVARSAAPGAACPLCGQTASRTHSRYERNLADLPWNGVPVRLRLRGRKFFCDNADCPRRVFAEPVPALAARYARRVSRRGARPRDPGAIPGEESSVGDISVGAIVDLAALPRHARAGVTPAPPASTTRAWAGGAAADPGAVGVASPGSGVASRVLCIVVRVFLAAGTAVRSGGPGRRTVVSVESLNMPECQ